MILGSLALERDSFFKRTLLMISLLFMYPTLQGQGIQGIVTESFSHHPIQNATIKITFYDSAAFQCSTNALGEYLWQKEKAGRAIIEVSAEGYQTLIFSDILFDGYATQQRSFGLERSSFDLEGVTVVASLNPASSFIRTITPEDALRIAGNFEDPVRIALSQPGIVLLNDQTNHLSARGQSPIFNSWYLEGLNIVNPNHTSNAGTLSDLPTQYGGGVNMFSAQTLGSTDIYMGVNPLSVNTVSGASFDMHFHESSKPEWRAKAGLLGFELGGGASVGNRGIIDFNLRYSFTGLLTNFGADFGGEKINYYDGVVSFRQEGKKHKLKLFAWAGRSTNVFEHVDPTEDREAYKDFFDIDYGNDILGAGGRYDVALGSKTNLKTGIAYSSNYSSYSKIGPYGSPIQSLNQYSRKDIASMFAELSMHHSPTIRSTLGVNYTTQFFKEDYTIEDYDEEVSSIRPYLSAHFNISPKWAFEVGGEMQDGNVDESLFGYRFQLNWRPSKHNYLFAGWRHAPNLPFHFQPYYWTLVHLISDTYEIGWKYTRENHMVGISVYSQQMKRLISFYLNDNHDEYLADYPNAQYAGLFGGHKNGLSRHIGIEGQWDFKSQTGWALNFNQSFYKSVRGIEDSALETGRYNGNFATHFAISKEILKTGEKNKFWNFSMRGIFNGGLWEPEIDKTEIAPPYYKYPLDFNQQLPTYMRIDMGITRTITRAKVRWRYSLDIQNTFGISNVAYHYYDPFLDEVVPQNQLGLIPVLSVQASW